MDLLQKFIELPRRFAAGTTTVEFRNWDKFQRQDAPELDLEIGDTVMTNAFVRSIDEHMDVYATGAVAAEALELPNGAKVTANVRTLFGIGRDEGELEYKPRPVTGLLITEILDVQ